LGKTYVVKGNELVLEKERLELREVGADREVVTTYSENGKVISVDTLTVKERPGW
jgi:hypothetical protein